MNYINTNYLAHHGVKGQKWGVRKQKQSSPQWGQRRYNPFKKKGLGKASKHGSVIGYTKTNKKGVTKQKSYRATATERFVLKKMGVINKDGSISTPTQQRQARKYCDTMKKIAIASAVASGVLTLGQMGVQAALEAKYNG